MFATICGVIFGISVFAKLYNVMESYEKDDEFNNN